MEEKTVQWFEVLGNPFLQGLHPRMLTDDGYTVLKLGRVRGMSKCAPPIPLKIIFHRDYVEKYLEITLLSKLKPTDYNQLQSVISGAYKIWKRETDATTAYR
jgi:hypothetical protein